MTTDCRLDAGPNGDHVEIDAAALKINGTDLLLDSLVRRSGNGRGVRRALVHGEGDTLLINLNNDYKGGVAIENVQLRLKVDYQTGFTNSLPKDGRPGDLRLIFRNGPPGNPILQLAGTAVSLWICVGNEDAIIPGAARWREIPLGDIVDGDQ